jgi:hypothetical protein
MKKYYLPKNDAERIIWLKNFAGKLNKYVEKFGIEEEMVSNIPKELLWLEQTIGYKEQFKTFLQSIIRYKDDMMNKPAAMRLPVIPAPQMEAADVQPGIFARLAKLVVRIKAHPSYTEQDGLDLGIIGAETDMPDTAVHAPAISIRIASGGYPEIVWHKGQMSGVEIQKQDDKGQWQLLAIDTIPNFIDTSALPPAGQPVRRTYRAIYLLNDARYGQWSDAVSVTLG